ncbi:transposase [Paracoccus aminovorans]|uniref:transposase n=1 Tax=Paracoccus aminovorans TaxID=34004 RepID=UPI00396F3515
MARRSHRVPAPAWRAGSAALRSEPRVAPHLDPQGQDSARAAWGLQGRQPVFSNAAIQFCLSIQVPFELPLRQTAGGSRDCCAGGDGLSAADYSTVPQTEDP